MSIRVGTSGWSYPSGRGTWNGVFYPPRGARGFRPGDELAYYADHFDTVEVNVTFYRPPVAATTARWVSADTARLRVLRQAAPEVHPPDVNRKGCARVRDQVSRRSGRCRTRRHPTSKSSEPAWNRWPRAASSGRFSCSSPPGFHADTASTDYLAGLLQTFRDYPLAVELRHRTWSDAQADTLRLLDSFGAAWVQIDEPKFRMSIRQDLVPNTERFYYLRLHGRNAAQWWSPDAPEERYNYLYSPEELRPFASVAQTVAPEVRKAYLYLNNHFAAKSVVNATVLKHQLGQDITGEYRPTMVEAYPELRGIVPRPLGDLL